MKTEPPIPHDRLIETLSQAYHVTVERLCYIPQGMVNQSYRAECSDGRRYYLKVWDESRLSRLSAARAAFYLPLTEQLYALGLPVPRILRATNGAFSTPFAPYTLAVYDYVEGPTLSDLDDSQSHIPALAAAIAQIHNATPLLHLDSPIIERYQIPFQDTLIDGLAALETITPHHRPAQWALRQLLFPHDQRIHDALQRLQELGAAIRTLNPAFVLCHTDLTPGNLIRTPSGDLCILDWEGAVFAPAEHDLFFFTGDEFSAFLATYEGVRGPVSLNANTFGFYFYRRNLEDITDFIVRILYENNSEATDQQDLQWLQSDCLDGLPDIERNMLRMETFLRP